MYRHAELRGASSLGGRSGRARGAPHHRQAAAWRLERALSEGHGDGVTDQGREYRAANDRASRDQGFRHTRTRPRHGCLPWSWARGRTPCRASVADHPQPALAESRTGPHAVRRKRRIPPSAFPRRGCQADGSGSVHGLLQPPTLPSGLPHARPSARPRLPVSP